MTVIKLLAGAALVASLIATPAFAADAIAPQTRENLLAAMHGEAFANLKYRRFAEVARESQLTVESLATALTTLLNNPARLARMAAASRAAAIPDAAERLADVVEETAAKRGR